MNYKLLSLVASCVLVILNAVPIRASPLRSCLWRFMRPSSQRFSGKDRN